MSLGPVAVVEGAAPRREGVIFYFEIFSTSSRSALAVSSSSLSRSVILISSVTLKYFLISSSSR